MFRKILAIVMCAPLLSMAADRAPSYDVKYSGGSLTTVKAGDDLKLSLDSLSLKLMRKKKDALTLQAASITEISYGQEVHRRIGTAAGLAVISLGIGAIVAFSKSKKHYIGLTWDDASGKGGIALQADKDDYRGLLTALEGITGKKAVDTDPEKK